MSVVNDLQACIALFLRLGAMSRRVSVRPSIVPQGYTPIGTVSPTRQHSRRHLQALVLASAVLGLASIPTRAAEQQVFLMRSALTSVAAATDVDAEPDPDDPGVGGGMDAINYFREALVADLSICTQMIDVAFSEWTVTHDVPIVLKEIKRDWLLAHAMRPGGGMFELVYRVNVKRARVTLFYYSNDGAQHQLAGIRELLKKFDVAALQDRLEGALQCAGEKQ